MNNTKQEKIISALVAYDHFIKLLHKRVITNYDELAIARNQRQELLDSLLDINDVNKDTNVKKT